jgi:hypothetical protein
MIGNRLGLARRYVLILFNSPDMSCSVWEGSNNDVENRRINK